MFNINETTKQVPLLEIWSKVVVCNFCDQRELFSKISHVTLQIFFPMYSVSFLNMQHGKYEAYKPTTTARTRLKWNNLSASVCIYLFILIMIVLACKISIIIY